MNRRHLLQLGVAALASPHAAFGQVHEASKDFGAVHVVDNHTRNIRKNHPWIKNAGSNANVFLWKFYEQVVGAPYVPHNQMQDGVGVGDCVGQSTAAAVNMLMATEIGLHNEFERWVARASVEAIYAGARNEIAEDVHDYKHTLKHGAVPLFAVEFLKAYGVLHMIDYGNYDLTQYKVSRSLDWASEGVPDELEDTAKEHPVQQFSKVANYSELSDALAAGQPVIIGSTYAVQDERDKDGFAKLYHENRLGARKKWFHCMVFIGSRNGTERPGVLLLNSHGPDWISGPKSFGQPDGSCWLEPDDAELMVKDWGDAYAISSYLGHPGKRIDKIKRKHKLF